MTFIYESEGFWIWQMLINEKIPEISKRVAAYPLHPCNSWTPSCTFFFPTNATSHQKSRCGVWGKGKTIAVLYRQMSGYSTSIFTPAVQPYTRERTTVSSTNEALQGRQRIPLQPETELPVLVPRCAVLTDTSQPSSTGESRLATTNL